MPITPHPLVNISSWLGFIALAGWFLHSRRGKDRSVSQRQWRLEHGLLGMLLIILAPAVIWPIASTAPHFGAREALCMLTWIAVLIYWFAALLIRLEGLQTILVPIAAISLTLSQLIPVGHATPWLSASLMQWHFSIAMLAYGFFAVAAGLAVLMHLADRHLHRPMQGLLRQLPPLLTLEKLLFATLTLGFALLTATLITGTLFAEALFGQPLTLNHKVVFSLAAWAAFGALLWGRHTRGWRGRLAVNWTLTGFGLLLLAYVGSRFVLDAVLHR